MADPSKEAKKAEKPSGNLQGVNVASGQKAAPPAGEVTGHISPGAWYACWHCGALNYVPAGYVLFWCWNDVVLNRC
jgi:hypothetical protein